MTLFSPDPNELTERFSDLSELDAGSSRADVDVLRFGSAAHGP